MTAPRYTPQKWNGLDSFKCAHCPRGYLDRGQMVNHVKRYHPTDAELAGGTWAELDAVPFASPTAKTLAEDEELGGTDFHGKEPTGSKGFTTDDVRHIAASRSPELE